MLQPKLYRSVVEDVIKNVHEAFLDDGVDDQVLNELKQVRANTTTHAGGHIITLFN